METMDTRKKIYNLIIVDESGSMECIYDEALAGMNETINTCKKMEELHPEMEQRITLVTFDSFNYKVHYDDIDAAKAKVLSKNDYRPCASTPLYDAIGRSIAKLNSQAEDGCNVLVTIITDGEENSSREYSLANIKNLIEKQKKVGWTFTLIGTDNLDVESMASAMAIDNHLSFVEDDDSTRKMFAKERRARERFVECCCCRVAPVASEDYFKED